MEAVEMGDGEVFLSTREADRVAVIREVVERRLPQSEAARRLGVGVRQVKRLVRRYRERGAAGFASSRRGRAPNNAIDAGVRRAVLDLVRERYEDFGPTFACEKLAEEHGRRLSAETLRVWMIEDGLWEAKPRRAIREHPSRPRRDCPGDLVQIDGSPHDWFEGRGPRCTLIVYVDDATSGLLAAGFHAAETTEAYMRTTRAHLASHGRPVAYYSDRCGVFRVNRRDREGEPTQFVRALGTLDIESIHAGSPQAKGRVERANRTLQDRLVKEMRLRGVCGMEAGNAYLPAFMADYNKRFAVPPRNPADAHRAVLHDERELDLILCEQHARKVTRNLSISFEGAPAR
jgi:transposase